MIGMHTWFDRVLQEMVVLLEAHEFWMIIVVFGVWFDQFVVPYLSIVKSHLVLVCASIFVCFGHLFSWWMLKSRNLWFPMMILMHAIRCLKCRTVHVTCVCVCRNIWKFVCRVSSDDIIAFFLGARTCCKLWRNVAIWLVLPVFLDFTFTSLIWIIFLLKSK